MKSKFMPSAVLLSYFVVIASLIISRGVAIKLFLLAIILILSLKIVGKGILKSIRSVSLFAIIIFLMNAFLYSSTNPIFTFVILNLTEEGIKQGFHVSYVIVSISLLTALILSYLEDKEVADGFVSLLYPLKYIRLPIGEIAMIFTLVFRFITIIKKESEEIINADKIRTAGGAKAKGFFLSILIPIFVSSFRRADNLSLAMEARGYKSTVVKRASLRKSDYKIIALSFAVLAVTLSWRFVNGT